MKDNIVPARKNILNAERNLVMTDYGILSIFAIALFWAIDPFQWKIGQWPVIKHIPFVFMLMALSLAMLGHGLFRRKEAPANLMKEIWLEMGWTIAFAAMVLGGSLVARFGKNINESFATMGLCALLAPATAWFILRAPNPMRLCSSLMSIITGGAVIAAFLQIIFAGQYEIFHNREHLVVPPLILVAFASASTWKRWSTAALILAAVVAANKFTSYIVLLFTIGYFAVLYLNRRIYAMQAALDRIIFRITGLVTASILIAGVAIAYQLLREHLPSGNTEYRMHTYDQAFEKFLQSPLWGNGFVAPSVDRFSLYTVASSTQDLPTHSDPLDVLANGGIVGTTLFILAILWPVIRGLPIDVRYEPSQHDRRFRLSQKFGLIALSGLLVCTVNPVLNNFNTGWVYWTTIGALSAVTIMTHRSRNISTTKIASVSPSK